MRDTDAGPVGCRRRETRNRETVVCGHTYLCAACERLVEAWCWPVEVAVYAALRPAEAGMFARAGGWRERRCT